MRSNRIKGIGVKMKIMKSYALKKFKNEIGQANHFLITILVGLDGVKSGKVVKNDEFDAAWNPKDVVNSANRSRIYTIKSSLAWVVDCLDMYLRLCNRKPRLLSDELSRKFDGTGHSVYEKYKLICEKYTVSEIDEAVVDLLICWRNRMTHFEADNDILKVSRNILTTGLSEGEMTTKYHLDTKQMLNSFDKKECPKFKEMAFMIRRTISFVESLDKILLNDVDISVFLEDMLCNELKNNPAAFNGIFSTVGDKRRQKIIQFIKSRGFVGLENNGEKGKIFIDDISAMSYKK
ncbi:hypothetical protein D7V83_05280 [bacterium 0.1xD8-71]|nr:hypothetical protein D7V83_05280 [bacterium 0.1xD8-71]